MNVYKELEKVVLPQMTDYQTDLVKHDRNWIQAHPGVPFLHYSSDTGTHFIAFHKLEEYPAEGVRVPYLFGHADREHLLNEVVEMAKYFNRERYYAKRVYYFDGKKLTKIDHGRAIQLATEYAEDTKRQWRCL